MRLTLWSWYGSAIGLRSWRVATPDASTFVLCGFVGSSCTSRSVFISRCWLDNNYCVTFNNTKKVQKLKVNIRKLKMSFLMCFFKVHLKMVCLVIGVHVHVSEACEQVPTEDGKKKGSSEASQMSLSYFKFLAL